MRPQATLAAAIALGAAATASLGGSGCGAGPGAGGGATPNDPAAGHAALPPPVQVVADFERAVLAGRAAYAELFDFALVGKVEKLLHRYDALGRVVLDDDTRAAFLAEDAVPFGVARERRNLGAFYPILAQRTVGHGGCRAQPPRSAYARRLAEPFPPLPAEPATNAGFEPLRVEVNRLIDRGGLVSLSCDGGDGALALLYTVDGSARGYSLITMYDDVEAAGDSE